MRHEFRDGTLYVPCDALRGELSQATIQTGHHIRKDGTTVQYPNLAIADIDCFLLYGSALLEDGTRSLEDDAAESAFIAGQTGNRIRNIDLSTEHEERAAEKERRIAAMALIAADAEAAGIPLADAIV